MKAIKPSSTLFSATLAVAFTLSTTPTEAASINDVYNMLKQTRTYTLDARSQATYSARYALQSRNTITEIRDALEPRVYNRLDHLQQQLDKLPDPQVVLGNGKAWVDDGLTQISSNLAMVQQDFNQFKGDDCGSGTQCDNLRQRLIGIYSGLNSIRYKLPQYDMLPTPDQFGIDPKKRAIENMPPVMLFGLHSLTGDLETLDKAEQLSNWVEGLRFYALDPVQEDEFYQLDRNECEVLEASIKSDNTHFSNIADTTGKIELVSQLMKEILPKDIVINAWVGTSIPNPSLPAAVYINQISSDFNQLLEKEVTARRTQVKACRTQLYRQDVKTALGIHQH